MYGFIWTEVKLRTLSQSSIILHKLIKLYSNYTLKYINTHTHTHINWISCLYFPNGTSLKRFLQLCLLFCDFSSFFYVIVYLLMLFNEKPLEKANFYASLQGNSTFRCCLPGSFQKLSLLFIFITFFPFHLP